MKPASSERSVEEVHDRLERERKNRDLIITRQSFYCSRKKKLVSPAHCHDCFARIPYLERLTRWSENRSNCVMAHRIEEKVAERTRPSNRDEKPKIVLQENAVDHHACRKEDREVYSIEEYVNRGLLEFLLELDTIAERFSIWSRDLARPARERIHSSAEIGEMIVWFSERLESFRRSVVQIGRENFTTTKEEKCGVKNSPSTCSE